MVNVLSANNFIVYDIVLVNSKKKIQPRPFAHVHALPLHGVLWRNLSISYFKRRTPKRFFAEYGHTLHRRKSKLLSYLIHGVFSVVQLLEQRLAFHPAYPSLGCISKTFFEVAYERWTTHAHLVGHLVNSGIGFHHTHDDFLKRQIHPKHWGQKFTSTSGG